MLDSCVSTTLEPAQEPEVLTLHYRDGPPVGDDEVQPVRKRSYKFGGCKDEFVATLQTAMERFI